MPVVKRFIVVNAPVETVAEFGMNPKYRTQWYDGMLSHTPDDSYPQTGSTAEVVVKSAGVKLELKERILAYEPGHSIQIKLDGKLLKGVTDWTYEPEGESGDQTRITAHFDYKMAGGMLGALANSLVVERANTKGLENSLRNLKRLAESQASQE
ncbi:MAG: hypothetical protein GYB66_13665 [Chloroflexi bacterium]|nr:hypothetical protein [Chloroflexota bacterium]